MRWIVVTFLVSLTAIAQADDRIAVEMSHIAEASPYQYRMTIRSLASQHVVTDRRLLHFEVHVEGRRRPYRCAHPQAPNRVDERRVQEASATFRYEEWIDLRMYCWGDALRALEQNVIISTYYGFRRRGRTRYIVKQPDERRPPHRVEGSSIAWRPSAEPDKPQQEVVVSLSPSTARGSVLLRPRVAATEGSTKVYLRDDLFWFKVSGPLGDVECRPDRTPITPIVDFFQTLRARGTTTSLDMGHYCPEGTFEVPGVYDVTAAVDLIYDGESFDIEAALGTFESEPVPVRVLGAEYVEQKPEDLLEMLSGAEEVLE